MKKIKVLSLLVVALLLTGCLAPGLRFTISPNPIKVKFKQTEIPELTLKVKTQGFGTNFRLDKAIVQIKDEKGESVGTPYEEKINETVKFIVPFVTTSVSLKEVSLGSIAELEEMLDEEVYKTLKDKEYTMTITLTGTKASIASAKIIFE